jgi:hypothetical protein
MPLSDIVNKHLTVRNNPHYPSPSFLPPVFPHYPTAACLRPFLPQYTYDNGWKYEFWLKSEKRIVYGEQTLLST